MNTICSITDIEAGNTRELACFRVKKAKLSSKERRIGSEINLENSWSLPKRRRVKLSDNLGSDVEYGQSMENRTDADSKGRKLTNRRDDRVCKTRVNSKEKEISRILILVLILCFLSMKSQAQQQELANIAQRFVASLNTKGPCHEKEGLMAPSIVYFPFDNG